MIRTEENPFVPGLGQGLYRLFREGLMGPSKDPWVDQSWEHHGLAFCLAVLQERRFLLLPRFQEGEASCGGLRCALRKNLFKEDAEEAAIQELFYLPG